MCLGRPKKFLQASEVEKSRKIQVTSTVKLRSFYQYFYVKKIFFNFPSYYQIEISYDDKRWCFRKPCENKLQRALHRKLGELQTNYDHNRVGGMDELFKSGHESEVRVLREISRQDEETRLPRVKSSSIPPT